MKYEAVFGDQALLEDAGTFTGLDVVTRNVTTGLYGCCRHEDLTYDYLRENPVIAMRRIIPEPKRWTVEDQKAGRLPEVGAEFKARGYVWECVRILNNTILAVVGDSYCGFDIDECKPIESPEEKAARLRSEWCNRAMDYSTIQQLYDALLTGDLPVPVAPEQNK